MLVGPQGTAVCHSGQEQESYHVEALRTCPERRSLEGLELLAWNSVYFRCRWGISCFFTACFIVNIGVNLII